MAKDFRGMSNYPIGLRNNNPGNLRTGISWQGAAGSSGGFVTFKSLPYGIRAAATNAINNISAEGNDTIRKLITKYAPPSENDTTAYINAVANYMGISPDDKLTTDAGLITILLKAIFEHENGKSYGDLITTDDINEGLNLLSPRWLMTLQNFFASNPTATAAGGFVLAAALVVFLIYVIKTKKYL